MIVILILYIVIKVGWGELGISIPGPGPIPEFSITGIPSLEPDTHFGREYPSPVGAGQPGSPPVRVKFPSLVLIKCEVRIITMVILYTSYTRRGKQENKQE